VTRYVVLHGHLYQPPREDPWTGTFPPEPGAAPFPNWNARITEECYRPNTHAAILDDAGDVSARIDNYLHTSVDVGPTLAVWLERHAPDVHSALVAADRAGRTAIAHPWVHAILPLCSERDRRTLVRWGLADFRRRFGREPEGMWLPETAVDTPTLETLAQEGIGFTILAQYQLEGEVDPRTPFRVELPSGRSMTVLAYSAGLSSAVAFDGLLHDGIALAHGVLAANGDTDRPSLVCVATDFETYGHHHRFGEMALARALHELGRVDGVRVVSAVEAVKRVAPQPAVLREPTAWSCAHGVERWRSDCGCRIGPPTPLGQSWRAPLREGLDWLRGEVAGLETLGSALLEPWAARDDYGRVLSGADGWEEWLTGRLAPGADPARGRTWLELQRHLLFMDSSCGWFFDDAAGHETVIVLRHAARALELVTELGGPSLEAGLLQRLHPMRSEDPRYPDGAAIWRELVVRR
jgi:alpha-amylase/alpha-mannosidase (GH57 family)